VLVDILFVEHPLMYKYMRGLYDFYDI